MLEDDGKKSGGSDIDNEFVEDPESGDSKLDRKLGALSGVFDVVDEENRETDEKVRRVMDVMDSFVMESASEIIKSTPVGRLLKNVDNLSLNKPLCNCLNRFNDLVRDLKLEKSPVLSDERVIEDFSARLEDFSRYMEMEINDLRILLSGNEEYTFFSDNWADHLRETMYFAFFIHYGAKRRAETDEDGQTRDYVYHPVRSTFNCLFRKSRFFDERVAIAQILHDSGEDFHKGLLSFLYADDEIDPSSFGTREFRDQNKENAAGIAEKKHLVFKYIEDFCNDMDEDISQLPRINYVSIWEMVQSVTKATSDRTRNVIDSLQRILDIELEDKRLEALIDFFMIKINDRLDNIKTIKSDPGKDPNKFKGSKVEMEDETIYVYLAVMRMFHMINSKDWGLDYLYFKDYAGRQRRKAEISRLREDAGASSRDPLIENAASFSILDEFRKDFRDVLNDHIRIDKRLRMVYAGSSGVEEGRDYILSFRGTGQRFQDEEYIKTLKERGIYPKSLQNLVIFHPVGEDPELAEAAREAFREMCASNPSKWGAFYEADFKRKDVSTALGSVVQRYGSGEVFPRENFSDKYGVVVWSVFDSEWDAVRVLLGELHAIHFYKCSIDKDYRQYAAKKQRKLEEFFEDKKEFIKRLSYFYRVRDNIQATIDSGELDEEKTHSYCVQLEKVDAILRSLVLSVFLEKGEKRTMVMINAEEGQYLRLPKDSDVATAILFTDPFLLGKPVKFRSDGPEILPGQYREKVKDHLNVLGNLNLWVDKEAPFDEILFNYQVSRFLNSIMPGYREELLEDEGMEGPDFER